MDLSKIVDKENIDQALKDFKIKGTCVSGKQYRHFLFYDLSLEPGAYKKLCSSLDELSIHLKSFSKPILKIKSSTGLVQLQLTNSNPHKFTLEDLNFKNNDSSFVLGETIEGEIFNLKLEDNPHLLIAGTTGSGKTNLLHNIIKNALHKHNVEIHLIDPKMIEFSSYSNQDKVCSISTSYKDACSVLQHVYQTMEDRYKMLNKNKLIYFTKIIVIIDELADLIFQDEKNTFESLLAKIGAKARACGIHLIAATQRPSVDVITGLIKANFPARLACKVVSRIDSQVILDEPGAENLLGKGDALFRGTDSNLTRIQIALT